MMIDNDNNDALSSDDLSLVSGSADDDAGSGADDAAADAGADPSKTPAPSADPAKPMEFGDNWREQWAAGLPAQSRDKALAALKTRNSPYDVLNATIAADAKISKIMAERVKVPTGDNDDPKDVEAYRKARGVPDKADDYKLDLPDGFELTQTDEQLKGDFFKEAHKRNWNQKDIDLAVQTHMAILKETEAEQAKVRIQLSQAAQDELRVHFGKDYRSSIELTNRMFEQEMGELGMTEAAERQEALSIPLADGRTLGEVPWFVKMMAKIARERSDDGAFEMGESGDGVDLDKKIDDIMDKKFTDPKEYERMQPELQRLVAAQNRRSARSGKGA